MIILGISGKRGAGKDLLASYLARKYGFVIIKFADALKEEVRAQFGLSREHTDGNMKEYPTSYRVTPFKSETDDLHLQWTARDIMIEYGKFFRRFDPDWWVKKVFQRIEQIKYLSGNNDRVRICISDLRFKNEAKYIKDQHGIMVRLERKPELNIYKHDINDISEFDLDDYEGFDYRLDAESNVAPDDLEKFSDVIMTNLYADKGLLR